MPEGKGYSASRGLCVSTYSGLDQDSVKSHLLLQLLSTLPLPFSKMPIRITNSILTFPRIKCSYFYQQVPIQPRNFSKFKWNEPTRAAMSDLGMQSEYLTDNWTPSCYPADFIACLLQCKTGNVTERVLWHPLVSWRTRKQHHYCWAAEVTGIYRWEPALKDCADYIAYSHFYPKKNCFLSTSTLSLFGNLCGGCAVSCV